MSTGAAFTIAGSDPSGGAGIQADLKTFAVLGVYGAAAITCLTTQNSRGVFSVQPVDPELVADQIKVVLADLPLSHIKIGMVGTTEIATRIGEALAGFSGEIIYDPVCRASSGQPLARTEGLLELSLPVLKRATVLTPNRMELEMLSGQSCSDEQQALAAARPLFGRFPNLRAVIVKGGHLQETAPEISDHLLCRDSGQEKITRPRRQTRNTHGTGCTLAAAFTAMHLLTGSYSQAFRTATSFVDRLLVLSSSARMGLGTGPLMHHLFVRGEARGVRGGC